MTGVRIRSKRKNKYYGVDETCYDFVAPDELKFINKLNYTNLSQTIIPTYSNETRDWTYNLIPGKGVSEVRKLIKYKRIPRKYNYS